MEWGFHVECIKDDMEGIAALFGFDVTEAYFSGFCSQGDGACIMGDYRYKTGSVAAIKAHCNDKEVLRIVEALAAAQKRRFYGLTATIQHRGHYDHEGCTSIDVYDGDKDADEDTTEYITELLRDFMRWYYKRLKEDYWYRRSEEYCLFELQETEAQFTEDGERFYA